MISKTIDELIDIRRVAREQHDWKLSDDIRTYLDTQLVFIFDATWGQEIYYQTEKYFLKKPQGITHRKYLEQRIQDDIKYENIFQGWLTSIRSSKS